MHLKELLEQYAVAANRQTAEQSVPQWMLGCFKRRSISFANGLTDTQTQVFWLQGRNLTIDLRLPVAAEQVTKKAWQECTSEELAQLANYEGWSADSRWQHEQLSWSGGVSLQIHNRWPEPAKLYRVGDCMMEFAPSGAYVEDWRLQSYLPGPLVSLRLIEERDLGSGRLRHLGGALIITGNWAGLVLGRAQAIGADTSKQQIRDRLSLAGDDVASNAQLFNFETSVAQGSLDDGFITLFSTQFSRLGEPLFSLEGFSFDQQTNQIVQHVTHKNTRIERRFAIDSLEQHFPFTRTSPWPSEAQVWFEQERQTLSRYLQTVS